MAATVLEDPLESILELPTAQRVSMLNRDDRLFHVILAQQLDRDIIESLCRLSEMIRTIAEARQGALHLRTLLAHKRAMLYFIQPSSRTFLSFAAACQIVGMPYNEVRNPSTSSEVKGETEDDTLRVLSNYFDLITIRHPAEAFAERTAHMINAMHRSIPVINGGSGKDQHPTQALLDIYTLYRCFVPNRRFRQGGEHIRNPFEGKKIAFVGDLARGRTVRSLVYLLCRYPGVRILFVSPPELEIGEDILEYLSRYDIDFDVLHDLRPVLPDCDAVYMTRIQDEHDVSGESSSIDYGKFRLRHEDRSQFKPDLAILHPLPRRDELDIRLDNDPRAKYWEQVRNGMWVRAALLAYVCNVDAQILMYYQDNYSR